jgi:hypothetical protein
MSLFIMLFPMLGLILTIFIIYWFYNLVQSNKEIAISQAKIATSLSEISIKLSSNSSTNFSEATKK